MFRYEKYTEMGDDRPEYVVFHDGNCTRYVIEEQNWEGEGKCCLIRVKCPREPMFGNPDYELHDTTSGNLALVNAKRKVEKAILDELKPDSPINPYVRAENNWEVEWNK